MTNKREKRDREILRKIFEELQLNEKDKQLINKMYERFKKANQGDEDDDNKQGFESARQGNKSGCP